MTFDKVLKYCIKSRISLNQFLVIYGNKLSNTIYENYIDAHFYNNKILSTALKDDLVEKGYFIKKDGKYKFTDKVNEVVELFKDENFERII